MLSFMSPMNTMIRRDLGFKLADRTEWGKLMSKFFQSLPLTIVAGVVLTIIMAFVTDAMVESPLDRAPRAFQDLTR